MHDYTTLQVIALMKYGRSAKALALPQASISRQQAFDTFKEPLLPDPCFLLC